MKSAAFNLLGVLTGLTLGWIAVATPLAAVLAPARITWDATSCPPGTYTITSTAQKIGSGESFVRTTTGVRLPRSTFVQEFANLPSGDYSVFASVQGDNGATFAAATQFIGSGQTQGAAYSSGHRQPTSVAALPQRDVGHQRTTSAQSSGYAPAQGAVGNASTVTSRPLVAGAAVTSQERSLLEIRRLLDLAGQVDWRRIEVLDVDGDGIIDRAAIEMGVGDIYLLVIRRQ